MIDGEDKAILAGIVVIIFGAILIIATVVLSVAFTEDKAAIRCAEYGYKCPKEEI